MKVVALSDRRAGSSAGAAPLDWQAATRAALLRARTDAGHWEGRLSTSALSTATAVIALATASRHDSGVVAHSATAARHDSGVVAHSDSGVGARKDSGVVGPIGGPAPAFADGERSAVAPFSVMRKKIAEHMVLSARTPPRMSTPSTR